MQGYLEPRPIHGALRSRIVAKLVGVSLRRLQSWHETHLIEAHAIPGARGYPRLYSWVDYIKARAVKHLIHEGLSPKEVRIAINYLEKNIPDWYRRPLYGLSGKAIIDVEGLKMSADEGRQVVLPVVSSMLDQLREEGPLGELRHFSDYVDMHPDILSGNPIIKGTRLETQFIAVLAQRGMSPDEIAETYHLSLPQVMRAIEFNTAAA